MVWPPGQSISFVHGARFVYYGEVELGKEERPSGLSSGEALLGTEVGEVVVVSPDFECLGMAF
jgi:hypothetical protein